MNTRRAVVAVFVAAALTLACAVAVASASGAAGALQADSDVESGAGAAAGKPKMVKPEVVYPIPFERETPTPLHPFFKPQRIAGSHWPPIADAPCVCAHITADPNEPRACRKWVAAPLYECKVRGNTPDALCVKYGKCTHPHTPLSVSAPCLVLIRADVLSPPRCAGPFLPLHYCPCIHADNRRECYLYGPPGSKAGDWSYQSADDSYIRPQTVAVGVDGMDDYRSGARVSATEYDRDVMARTLWSEARYDDLFGQRGVAWVMVNRVRDRLSRFPTTLSGVCRQKGQFHAWSQDRTGREYRDAVGLRKESTDYLAARMIVDGVLAGRIEDPTRGAQFYYARTHAHMRTRTFVLHTPRR
jgi:N-acetylmuramoyl-L-alanine amidase